MIKSILEKMYGLYADIRQYIIQRWYTFKIREQAADVGRQLKVNGPSKVNSKTVLGDNVNFNGIKVRGDGQVSIGDNFHSGPGVWILTRTHNYDEGEAIPGAVQIRLFSAQARASSQFSTVSTSALPK
jgi:acetyltransferase-like isoleucine patch superfamily enzyme